MTTAEYMMAGMIILEIVMIQIMMLIMLMLMKMIMIMMTTTDNKSHSKSRQAQATTMCVWRKSASSKWAVFIFSMSWTRLFAETIFDCENIQIKQPFHVASAFIALC